MPPKKPTATEETELAIHVAVCHERYKTLFGGLRRIEAIMIAGTGSTILFLAAIVWKMYGGG